MQVPAKSPRNLFKKSRLAQSLNRSDSGAISRSQASGLAANTRAANSGKDHQFSMQEHAETILELWDRMTKQFY